MASDVDPIITIHKFDREVRRVLEYLGLKVNRLIRTRYGPFDLGESEPGALIEIKQGDLSRFLGMLKRRG